MNHVMLTGNMVRDPELKSTGSGKSVLPFTLAVCRVYSKKEEERVKEYENETDEKKKQEIEKKNAIERN